MRYLLAATLVAAQLASAPVQAATLEPVEALQARAGAFAGARLRLAFGGRETGKLRAGLGVGASRLSLGQDGRFRSSFGEGVELGFVGGSPVRLSIAGRSMEQLKLGADGKSGGLPAWAWVAGGVVVLGVAAFAAYAAVGDAATE